MRCEIFIANALQFNTKPASNTDVRRLKVALRVALDERRLETRLRSNPYRHMSIVMVVIGEHYEDHSCARKKLARRARAFPWWQAEQCRFSEPAPGAHHRCRALFPVRYPDVFYLNRVLQEPSALRLVIVEPINDSALVGKDLLEISYGQQFHLRRAAFVSKRPYGIDIVVFSDDFGQLGGPSRNDVHNSGRKVAGIK